MAINLGSLLLAVIFLALGAVALRGAWALAKRARERRHEGRWLSWTIIAAVALALLGFSGCSACTGVLLTLASAGR